MGVSEIIASVDREIAILQQARALLGGAPTSPPRKRAGRRANTSAAVKTAALKPAKTARKKRKLSPEGRKRIAEAVKRRWEAQRKASATAK